MGTYTTQCVVCIEFLFIVGDLTEFNFCNWFADWQHWSCVLCSCFAFLFCSFAFTQFTIGVHWEQDQLATVFLQTLDIFLLSFNGLVAATAIHSNTDGLSKAGGNSSTLKETFNTEN